MQNDTNNDSPEITPFKTLYQRRDGQLYGISHIYHGQYQSVVPEHLANAGEGYSHKSERGAEAYLLELIQKHENAEERFQLALENADNAFWAEIAKSYPEIKSGDLGPDVVIPLSIQLEKAVASFIIGNVENPSILPSLIRADLLPADIKPKKVEEYVKGMRIKLLDTMKDDPDPVIAGAYGTVTGVDDAGHIQMSWDDNQGSLALIPGKDNFVIVTKTLEEFVATRREVASIPKELHNEDSEELRPGFIYIDSFYIEKCNDGNFLLPLGRDEFESSDLAYLEKVLYDAHFHY